MSRVNEILEQIMLEDADAVLYSVMLSFLKRKAKEYGEEVVALSFDRKGEQREKSRNSNCFDFYVSSFHRMRPQKRRRCKDIDCTGARSNITKRGTYCWYSWQHAPS